MLCLVECVTASGSVVTDDLHPQEEPLNTSLVLLSPSFSSFLPPSRVPPSCLERSPQAAAVQVWGKNEMHFITRGGQVGSSLLRFCMFLLVNWNFCSAAFKKKKNPVWHESNQDQAQRLLFATTMRIKCKVERVFFPIYPFLISFPITAEAWLQPCPPPTPHPPTSSLIAISSRSNLSRIVKL